MTSCPGSSPQAPCSRSVHWLCHYQKTLETRVLPDRMPPLDLSAMTDAQLRAADELTAGPRGGVKGPFIPLLRSPELMDRLQKVGDYLRFHSSLEPRISEFIMLIVSREWSQQFEWSVHVPLGRKAGLG